MKLNRVIATALITSIALVPSLTFGEGNTFTVFSNQQAFSSSQLKLGSTGRIMVPLRNAFSPHGYNVQFQKATNLITLAGKDETIIIKPKSKSVKVGNRSVTLSALPQSINGTTYIPFVDIPKLSNTKFEWDLGARTISIVSLDAVAQTNPNSTLPNVVGNYNKYGAINYKYEKVETHEALAQKATTASDVEVILLSNSKVVKQIKDFGAFYLSDISTELDGITDIVVLDHTNKIAYGLV